TPTTPTLSLHDALPISALQDTLDALIELDSLYARARYALEYNGRRPEILPRGVEDYVVVNGHHPLLLAGPDPVVPFDLALAPERSEEHTSELQSRENLV